MLSDRCLSYPVCDVGVLWPNGWMDQDETWHAGRPQPWPHCVRSGPTSPSPKGHSPQFSTKVRSPSTTSGLETEWDYSRRKNGRDGQKKTGKASEKRRKGKSKKRAKDKEVNGQGHKGETECSGPMRGNQMSEIQYWYTL